MIKKFKLTIILLSIILDSFSQDALKETKNNINISTELGNWGIYLFPNYMRDIKKSTIGLGLIFMIYPSYNFATKVANVYYPTDNKFYGFHLYYQYNFRPDKIFDLFIQTNLSYENVTFLNYEESSHNYKINYQWSNTNLNQTLGLGFKINFTKKLYTNTSLDFGFKYFDRVTEKGLATIQTESKSGFSGIIRLGLGYRF